MAARAIHREGQVGALAPGALADLVVVDADPLADIRALQDVSRIRVVMQGGRAVAGTLVEELPPPPPARS
jgi:imidazolonepropionase-like amidohydrolase